jgi:hypothetical protein
MGLSLRKRYTYLKNVVEDKIKELEDTIEVERAFERDAIFRDKIIEGSQRMISIKLSIRNLRHKQ